MRPPVRVVIIIAAIIGILVSTYSFGQKINQQIWTDFHPRYYLNDKIEYYGDLGFRTNINGTNWGRLYIRPSFRYHKSTLLEFHGGLGLFYFYSDDEFNRFEITPWQGIRANWPNLRNWGFNHLLRIEERFSFLSQSDDYDFDLRLRYKLSGSLQLNEWYLPVFGEAFLPIQDGIRELYRNRGRAGVGLGRKMKTNWAIALLFNWQTSRTGPNQELQVADYIYQIRIKKFWQRANK